MLDLILNFDRALRLRESPPKMHGRRIALRKHLEEPFDKDTSEYYACGRKGVQGKKPMLQFALQSLSDSMYIAGAPSKGDAHGHSSTLLDTDGSDLLRADADGKMQYVSPCGFSYWSQDDDFLDQSIEDGKLNGLSFQEDKQANCDTSGWEPSPHFVSSVDESDSITLGVNKMGSNVSFSNGIGDGIHDFSTVCKVGFSSQRGPAEEEITMPALSLSPSRGGHRRTFPPPLNLVATQSYCDKLGQSPGACSAGSCLRSFRCNGRFVLQEVKAPTHKYFRVLRGDGRLKLELVDAENDTSAEEDDEASVSDLCMGVESSNSIEEMVCASEVCAGDASVGSSQSSTLYAEGTCIASSQVEKLMPLDCRAGVATEGCGKANDLAGNSPMTNAEKSEPLNCVGPDAPTAPGTMAIASESPSSPRCIEIRALYSGPSPRIKSSWVRPISAF